MKQFVLYERRVWFSPRELHYLNYATSGDLFHNVFSVNTSDAGRIWLGRYYEE